MILIVNKVFNHNNQLIIQVKEVVLLRLLKRQYMYNSSQLIRITLILVMKS